MSDAKFVVLPVEKSDGTSWDMAFPIEAITFVAPYVDEETLEPSAERSQITFAPESVRLPRIKGQDSQPDFLVQITSPLTVEEVAERINGPVAGDEE